jgi:hypothetical protein
MSLKRIIREANEGNVMGFQEALGEELRSRIALALEAKKEDMFDDEDEEDEMDDEEEDEIYESFKTGDVIKVAGAEGSIHSAVMVSPTKAYYIPDSGEDSLDEVPDTAMKKASLAKRVTAAEKNAIKEMMKNLK